MSKNCTIQILNTFLEEVEKMEKCVLVPNRLQDIGPHQLKLKISNEGDVEDIEGLHTMFLVLKNIRSELTTGYGLEHDRDLNPIRKHLQDMNKMLLNMAELAKTVCERYKKEYDLVF